MGVKRMYTGTMIDQLMASVARAEEHAYSQPKDEMKVDVHATYIYEFRHNEKMAGVA